MASLGGGKTICGTPFPKGRRIRLGRVVNWWISLKTRQAIGKSFAGSRLLGGVVDMGG